MIFHYHITLHVRPHLFGDTTLETAIHTTQQQANDGNEKLVVAHLFTELAPFMEIKCPLAWPQDLADCF